MIRFALFASIAFTVALPAARADEAAPVVADAKPTTRVAVWGLRHDHVWGLFSQLKETPGAQLVAIGGERDDLLERARRTIGTDVPQYRDLKTMLDTEHPDALLALVPNSEHLATLQAAAARKIAYYTHKPGATSLRDARAMERLAREAGIVSVLYCYPVFDKANQLLFSQWQAGAVGPVRKLLVMSGIQGPHELHALTADYEGWLYDPRQHGGGSLMDMGTYGLLYAAWILGRPSSVMAMVSRHAPEDNPGAEDESWIMLDYPGANAVIQGSWSMPFRQIGEIVISGPKGQLRNWEHQVLFRPRAPDAKTEGLENGNPLTAPEPPPERKSGVAHFIDAIRNGTPVHPAFTPAMHVTVAEIVEAAYRSAKTGRRIFFRARPLP
jgi:predicted dehydrogenase